MRGPGIGGHDLFPRCVLAGEVNTESPGFHPSPSPPPFILLIIAVLSIFVAPSLLAFLFVSFNVGLTESCCLLTCRTES